jgi:hypothetical protein
MAPLLMMSGFIRFVGVVGKLLRGDRFGLIEVKVAG